MNSMSDLFHEAVPDEYILKVVSAIKTAGRHTFQVLTKRAERMAEFFGDKPVPDNLWIGVTAENIKHGLPRMERLREIKATTRFISMEPLLEGLREIERPGYTRRIIRRSEVDCNPEVRPARSCLPENNILDKTGSLWKLTALEFFAAWFDNPVHGPLLYDRVYFRK